MDRYEACKDIAKRLAVYNVSLEFCNKAMFAANYKKLTGLSLKEVNRILTSINKTYPIVWYHTKGFIFSYELKSKINKNSYEFEIEWGTYYSLFHLYYNKEFLTSGGKHKGYSAIHPNIYNKGPVDNKSHINGIKICLPYEIRAVNHDQLIKTGGIASFIDQVLTCVQTNDGNGLMYQFEGKVYNSCKRCGVFLPLDEKQCKECIDDENNDDNDE